jgi:hypothetical protein
MKRSPTPTPEDDEQYEDRHRNYEVERNAHQRYRGEDLIWRTRMKREEYNINQRTRLLDIHKAHLHIRECRCNHYEAEIHAVRMRGYGYENSEWIRVEVCIINFNKKHVRFSSNTTRLVIKCSILHAII